MVKRKIKNLELVFYDKRIGEASPTLECAAILQQINLPPRKE